MTMTMPSLSQMCEYLSCVGFFLSSAKKLSLSLFSLRVWVENYKVKWNPLLNESYSFLGAAFFFFPFTAEGGGE